MLDTEGRWSQALNSNNIRAIISWLTKLTAEDEADVDEILQTFSCWVQRTSEFAKKELLSLCFNRCHGLWMFLDRSSFTRVHTLLQRLRNLLTLAQWARRQLSSAHLWHGVGVPCVVCRDTLDSSDVKHSCWNRERRVLKQHIWLGRLVQWWGIMGLLPKYPEAQEVKRITRMWKGMDQSHRRACLRSPGDMDGEKERFKSLIEGMVTQLDRQHGCHWISEDCTAQCYPPPNLLSVLKLVLVPHIDSLSVQALLMYFILDIVNFLQCKDDLLQSFCKAFTIPSSFSQQIRAFWMLDHGHIKASMELLLSPKAAAPSSSWQHRCILRCLLTRKHPQLALRYLHWTRPPIQSLEDTKLCASVLLQNSFVSEAWALLKRGHTENNNMAVYFLQACHELGLCVEALKYIPAGYNVEEDNAKETRRAGSQIQLTAERPPCPLSAELYQAQSVNTVSSEKLIQLFIKAAKDVRKPHAETRPVELQWPEHTEMKSHHEEEFQTNLALHRLSPSPPLMDIPEQTAYSEKPEEQPVHKQPLESPHYISPSPDLGSESLSSFTLASSLPLLSRDPPYVFETTLTMQRISSLLADGERLSEEEEDDDRDSRTPSSVEALPDCPVVTVTLEGATDPVILSSWEEGALFLPAEAVTDKPGSAASVDQKNQSDCIPIWTLCETLTSNSFREDKLHQDPLTDLHFSLLPEDPEENHSKASAGEIPQDISLQTSGSSLTPDTTGDVQTASAPSDSNNQSLQKAHCDATRVHSITTMLGHEETGSEFKQREKDGGAASKSANQKSSFALSQPFSQSMFYFMDFTAKQRGETEAEQADKEEPAAWSSLVRDAQGAIRSGRMRSRKGKRVKRA